MLVDIARNVAVGQRSRLVHEQRLWVRAASASVNLKDTRPVSYCDLKNCGKIQPRIRD